MKSITQAIGVLCISGYIMGLLMNMVQITYTQKVVRMVVAMFIIITIFKPVRELAPNSLDAIAYGQNITVETGQNALENIVTSAQTQIESTIKLRLDEKKIGYDNISVHIYEQEAGLTVSKIEVFGAEESLQADIVNILSDIAQKEVIIFGG